MNNTTIEEYMKELDEISAKIKDDNLSLDESMKLYKKGIQTVKKAELLLDKYRGELEIIKKDETDV